MSSQEPKKSPDAIFLHSLCSDGSLSTVVRRKQLSKRSLVDLKLAYPLLTALDADYESMTSQQTTRQLRFQYPYKDSWALANAASLSRLPSQKVLKPQRWRKAEVCGSQRDSSTVQLLETTRNSQDLVRKALKPHLPPLHLSFAVDTASLLSNSTSKLPAARKFTLQWNWSKSDFHELGFEQPETALKLRTILRKKHSLVSLNESKSLESAVPKLPTQKEAATLKSERDEVRNFLQEEFRKKLEEGYLSKMRYVRPLGEERLLAYRGMELL